LNKLLFDHYFINNEDFIIFFSSIKP